MELKIIEWNVNERNVNERNTVGKLNEDRREKIVEKIKELKADVVVLTEVKLSYRDFMEALPDHYFALGSNNGGNGNNIIIAVSSTNIERVLFEDYYISPTNKSELGRLREHEKRNHPDRLLAKVKLKDYDSWLKILGIRMQVSGLSFYDFEDQKEALKFEIKDADYPNVIIGDFNWFTAIERPKFDKELKEYIADKGYVMFPPDNKSFSFISDQKGNKHYTSPDRALYRKKLGRKKLEIVTNYYHPSINKTFEGITDDWPSDHDILVVTVKMNNKRVGV